MRVNIYFKTTGKEQKTIISTNRIFLKINLTYQLTKNKNISFIYKKGIVKQQIILQNTNCLIPAFKISLAIKIGTLSI